MIGRLLRALAVLFAVLLLTGFLLWAWLLRFPVFEAPEPPGRLVAGSIEHAGRTRTYQLYVPVRPASAPTLVVAFHGSMGDGAQARDGYGRAFDLLAERDGFLVAYPDGFDRHWNGCRGAGPYLANELDVDDVGFFAALVDRLVRDYSVDATRVYATGISNGGQMALRLALEAPDRVRAVAPVIASLPSGDNLACTRSGQAVSLLLMNGTEDPMNPWAGGEVALYGLWGNRGSVHSSDETVAYFAGLAGHTAEPEVFPFPDRTPGDGSVAVRRTWAAPARATVALVEVRGGGHTVPHPGMRMPRIIGRTNQDFVAAEEVWRFFAASP